MAVAFDSSRFFEDVIAKSDKDYRHLHLRSNRDELPKQRLTYQIGEDKVTKLMVSLHDGGQIVVVCLEINPNGKIDNPPEAFKQLMGSKESIEAEIGSNLEWNDTLPNSGRVMATRTADLKDPGFVDWTLSMLDRFYTTFFPYIDRLQSESPT